MSNIDQLIQQAEGKTLEFKRDLSSPKPVMKTLVAFANTAGGRLIIGVNDIDCNYSLACHWWSTLIIGGN